MKITKFWKLYPTKRKKKNISNIRVKVSKETRKKLQKFGKEYFDGDRKHGYGGYYYNKKFFRKIVKEIIKHYKLKNDSKILEIGCAKGFMMYDFKYFLPKAEVRGLDISTYCKSNALPKIKKFIKIGSCEKLPFKSNYFDFVISISTIHNLHEKKLIKAKVFGIVGRVTANRYIRLTVSNHSSEKYRHTMIGMNTELGSCSKRPDAWIRWQCCQHNSNR